MQNEMRALVGTTLAGTADTKDEASRGIEFEVTANLTRNWTAYASATDLWTAQVNVSNGFSRVTDQGAQYRYPRFTEPRQFIYTLTAQF